MNWTDVQPGDMVMVTGDGLKLFEHDVFLIVGLALDEEMVNVTMLARGKNCGTNNHRMSPESISPVFTVVRNGVLLS